MNRALLLFALPTLGCLDYDLNAGKDDPEGMSDPEGEDDPEGTTESACGFGELAPEAVAPTDACAYDIGGFTPVIKWEVDGSSTALPVVADLDGDGVPEVIYNQAGLLSPGELAAFHGDSGDEVWVTRGADTGFGAHPAVADLDDDGSPEILYVRQYASSLFGPGDYTVVMLDADGVEIAESDHYVDAEFDYASGPIVSDMDHDGEPEIVVGRVILHSDLSERGVGRYGRGCPALVGIVTYGEGAQPAVADLDLDGIEEVIVGDAMYDPDGNVLWNGRDATDSAVAVANLDDDLEGEFVSATYSTIWARETNGDLLWELRHPSANILSSPAIGDVDNDGYPEIAIAGGNEMWVLNHDGTTLWTASVHDESGATGAAMFDFDADGTLEIVYIDEVQMIAWNGADGTVKFQTNDHASATMYDYPVIADIDADGHAEIAVVHDFGYSSGLSIYEDVDDSWAPARLLWNQHNYTITNINDDLSVPVTATQNFTIYNSFHSGLAGVPGESLGNELDAEITNVCRDDCDRGLFWVQGRLRNAGDAEIEAGVAVSLYARIGGQRELLDTQTLDAAVPPEMTSETLTFMVDAAEAEGADALVLSVDDDGTGTGVVAECLEDNNQFTYETTLCD
jgi:hypothetical protein